MIPNSNLGLGAIFFFFSQKEAIQSRKPVKKEPNKGHFAEGASATLDTANYLQKPLESSPTPPDTRQALVVMKVEDELDPLSAVITAALRDRRRFPNSTARIQGALKSRVRARCTTRRPSTPPRGNLVNIMPEVSDKEYVDGGGCRDGSSKPMTSGVALAVQSSLTSVFNAVPRAREP